MSLHSSNTVEFVLKLESKFNTAKHDFFVRIAEQYQSLNSPLVLFLFEIFYIFFFFFK